MKKIQILIGAIILGLAKEGSEEERFLFELELSLNDDLKRNMPSIRKYGKNIP